MTRSESVDQCGIVNSHECIQQLLTGSPRLAMSASPDTDNWDPTYPAYYQLADVLKSMAQSHAKVNIDDTTLLRWREVMGVMREVDTQYDDTSTSSESILGELRGFERFQNRYPHISPTALGPVTHEHLMSRASRILKLGRFVSEAETPYRYLRLRAAEAVQTVAVFADTATDDVLSQPRFAQKFMPGLRSLGIAAYLLDSAHDISYDYMHNKADLKPTRRFRVQALAASARHTLPFLPMSLHAPVMQELRRAAHIRSDRSRYALENK